MIVKEISNLGVIFTYDSVKNILLVILPQAHVLPRAEAERVWQLVRAYAASNPNQPELVIEIGNRRIEYGKVEPSFHYLSQEHDPKERRYLSLMSQSATHTRELLPLMVG